MGRLNPMYKWRRLGGLLEVKRSPCPGENPNINGFTWHPGLNPSRARLLTLPPLYPPSPLYTPLCSPTIPQPLCCSEKCFFVCCFGRCFFFHWCRWDDTDLLAGIPIFCNGLMAHLQQCAPCSGHCTCSEK